MRHRNEGGKKVAQETTRALRREREGEGHWRKRDGAAREEMERMESKAERLRRDNE